MAMLIVVFMSGHAILLLAHLLRRLIANFRCPRCLSSGSDGDGVPIVLFSESHANYYRFVLSSRAMKKAKEQQDALRRGQRAAVSGNSSSPTKDTSSPKDQSFSELEAHAQHSSSTASTSKDLSATGSSACSHSKYSTEKERAASSNNGKKSKGKATPNNNHTSSQDTKRKPSKSKVDLETTERADVDNKNVGPLTDAEVRRDKPPRLLPTLPTKGKFGPNTVPKGGARRCSEIQAYETNVSQPIAEESPQDPDVLTTQPLPRSRPWLHRQSTTSVEPLTTTDTGAHTTEAEIHFLSESSERRYTKKSQFSSLDSVKSLTDDGADISLRYGSIGRLHRNVIDPRIRDDILKSVPVSSQADRQPTKKSDIPSVHWPRDVRVLRQKLASIDVHDTPPSPAPQTPLKPKSHSFHEKLSWPILRPDIQEEKRAECSYEEFKESSTKKQKRTTFAPRLVVIRGPPDFIDEGYQPTDKLKYIYKQSYYGEASPSRTFDPYFDPGYITPPIKVHPTKTFVKNVYEQYYSDKRPNIRQTETAARMNPLEDHERKIIIEFCHLLEKSKQLFNGLRELPQYGHKQWSLYFGRTFDIYTRLWKYQQQHRAVLDSKYGMKRWQIGEIASKIGQLYYHFYLRTSETAYLNEAFSFYYAIRGRCYYTKANKEDKCELMVKKLRYYARFIVVCLLLNKMKLVKELIKELERQIIEYGNTYDPDDQVEWTVVVDEVKAFIHAEPVVSVVNTDNQTMILSHRLSPLVTPPVERSPQMNLSLQEILIVGSSSQQVKFSELTMDMFRMLQTLEREPSGDIQHIFDESPRQRFMSTPNAPSQEGVEMGQKMPNPHKYLLFKPSPGQMLVYLSSACNDLPPNGAVLLYISADGYISPNVKHADEATWGYDLGGLITTSKNDIYRECSKDPKSSSSSKFKELQCFYPGDLYPYTRRPLFLIVDSDNSYAFQNVPRHFGQPLVILMSPLDLPPSYHDPRRQGSLFTLFLHSPLEGLCYACDLSSVALALWDRAQMLLDTFMAEVSSILVRSRIDPTYISFMGDDFFRLLLLRFVFCEAVLRLHRLFRGRTHRTRCSPVLPDELFEHPTLVHIILDIANVLQIRNHIIDPSVANASAVGPN